MTQNLCNQGVAHVPLCLFNRDAYLELGKRLHDKDIVDKTTVKNCSHSPVHSAKSSATGQQRK